MRTNKNNNDYLKGFSANERALLEGIPTLTLRKIAASIVRFKFRMQFTGWLQYIIPLFFLLFLSIIGFIAQLFSAVYISILFLSLAFLLFLITIFDLITSKFRLRFHERIPKRKDYPDVFDSIRSRRSCRSFQINKMTSSDYNELMESVRIRTNQIQSDQSSIRFEYISAPITVWPVVNASEFLIAIAPKQYNRTAVKTIGSCLQKIVVDATRMGLATCWIGP